MKNILVLLVFCLVFANSVIAQESPPINGEQFLFAQPLSAVEFSVMRLNQDIQKNQIFRDSLPLFEETIPLVKILGRVETLWIFSFMHLGVEESLFVIKGKNCQREILSFLRENYKEATKQVWFHRGYARKFTKQKQRDKFFYVLENQDIMLFGEKDILRYALRNLLKPPIYAPPFASFTKRSSEFYLSVTFDTKSQMLTIVPDEILRGQLQRAREIGIQLTQNRVVTGFHFESEFDAEAFTMLSDTITKSLYASVGKLQKGFHKGRHNNPHIHHLTRIIRLFGEVMNKTEGKQKGPYLSTNTEFQQGLINWLVEKLTPQARSYSSQQNSLMAKTVELKCEKCLGMINSALILHLIDNPRSKKIPKVETLFSKGYLSENVECPAAGVFSIIEDKDLGFIPVCSVHGRSKNKIK